MKEKNNLIRRIFSRVCKRLVLSPGRQMGREDAIVLEKQAAKDEKDMGMNKETSGKTVQFTEQILAEFRQNVGRFRAETGGMLASSRDESIIDRCHFDELSQNTHSSFYYDVESMSEVYRAWRAKGYVTNGIYHSHPRGLTYPTFHDISTALMHIDFFDLEYFYLPIFQPEQRGFYTMYFYLVLKQGDQLVVNLDHVLKATQDNYEYIPYQDWQMSYSIARLNSYRDSIASTDKTDTRARERSFRPDSRLAPVRKEAAENKNKKMRARIVRIAANRAAEEKNELAEERKAPIQQYFAKVASLYPDKVLDKVLVCIGTGGARSFLENCARSGFRNFILIDADIVSPTNVATQGVFISEMGKKKVHMIRDRILDINPLAQVVCVEKFLDDKMSDAKFRGYLDRFPGKQAKDYLILGCTDNFEAQKRSALLALKYQIPYLAAMMYEGGLAAEIIFVYPGVTPSCPRCMLRDRFEKYENGFENDVDSSACPIFATERMNALKGYIALMLLMYGEDEKSPFSRMLDDVKERNFVEIRLSPYLKDSKLGIGLFDQVLTEAMEYVYFDETLWVPQYPDSPEFGTEACLLCAGRGDLSQLAQQWKMTDTRKIQFSKKSTRKITVRQRPEKARTGLVDFSWPRSSFEKEA